MNVPQRVIEIEELVLIGKPGQAAIQAALQAALCEAGTGNALGVRDAESSLAREVTQAAMQAIQVRGA